MKSIPKGKLPCICNVGHEGRARSEVKYASHSMPSLGYFTGEDLLTI